MSESASTNIRLAVTDAEIGDCYPVMRELRPEVTENTFLPRVRAQEKTGYRLAMVLDGDEVVAVAGFRIGENLAWGRFLYVDDLVATAARRSRGHGSHLLAWLRRYAVDVGCMELHLDSGIHRKAAHRFYEREELPVTSLHFATRLG